jgi:hypothetical protein
LTDFNGIAVGAENEKIKNVLSITPFGVSGGTSNKPTAYTVSSVDELPSDAVDGSTAIVPSDSIIGGWEFDYDNPLDFSALNLPDGTEVRLYFCGDNSENLGWVSGFGFENNENGKLFRILAPILENDTDAFFDGMWDDNFGKFHIYTNIKRSYCTINDAQSPLPFTVEDFELFMRTNATRLRGGYSLYTRENGEWVYKCEVV